MDEEKGGPEMKTLTYGSLNITIELDEHEEEILQDSIKEAVASATKHHNWVHREGADAV